MSAYKKNPGGKSFLTKMPESRDVLNHLSINLSKCVKKTASYVPIITIYLLLARNYHGELPTLPGIYFSKCFREVEKTRGKVNFR